MNKRVYSLNLASYLRMKGHQYEICDDEERNLKYFMFDEDLTEEIQNYKKDKELQSFIINFKMIKNEIHM